MRFVLLPTFDSVIDCVRFLSTGRAYMYSIWFGETPTTCLECFLNDPVWIQRYDMKSFAKYCFAMDDGSKYSTPKVWDDKEESFSRACVLFCDVFIYINKEKMCYSWVGFLNKLTGVTGQITQLLMFFFFFFFFFFLILRYSSCLKTWVKIVGSSRTVGLCHKYVEL